MNNNLKDVSKMFSVPLKSLKRWIKVGPERKKGMVHFILFTSRRRKKN